MDGINIGILTDNIPPVGLVAYAAAPSLNQNRSLRVFRRFYMISEFRHCPPSTSLILALCLGWPNVLSSHVFKWSDTLSLRSIALHDLEPIPFFQGSEISLPLFHLGVPSARSGLFLQIP